MESKLSEKNLHTYNNMVKYIKKSQILDSHKRDISDKICNLYMNINKREEDLEKFTINPKKFCDEIVSSYKQNTNLYLVYIEVLKKFLLVMGILSVSIDLFTTTKHINKYFMMMMGAALIVALSMQYLKLKEGKYGDFEKESKSYTILYNLISIILIVPLFIFKDILRTEGNISIIFIGIVCMISFGLLSIYLNICKNKINKSINKKVEHSI